MTTERRPTSWGRTDMTRGDNEANSLTDDDTPTDTPAGVSRLWEGRPSRADSQSRVYAVAAAEVPLVEQFQTQTV
jgi:hypothetical protein